MTLKSIALLLESRGHDVRYSVRTDGGIRIKEIDGKTYSLSEGNKAARQLAGRPASETAMNQRVKARANIDKALSKYLIRQKKEMDRILSAPPSKRKTQEQKDRIKEHKEAEKFERQRKKWLKQYRKEQQQYKKRREQGMSSRQALRQIKKTTKTGIPLSPTVQHAKYVQELLKAESGDFGDIQELLKYLHANDTLKRFHDLLAKGLTTDDYKNLGIVNDTAKGVRYDIRNAKDKETEEDVRTNHAAPLERELRKWLEGKGIKQPQKDNITDLMAFLWENHRTGLWRQLRDSYKSGAVSDEQISQIRSAVRGSYHIPNIEQRKAVRRAIIRRIEGIVQ